MSHQVPEYYRYVSSIEIDNPGSGYTSVPTITIAGGGGSGATATSTIVNGQIQTINITAIGNNYTTAPTVTVSGGGGSGAQLSAILAFAVGTPTEYTEKSSIGVKYTLPEFIQNDYDQFVTFIEKYYEYMDSDGNPINVLLNKKYNDIDDLSADELDKRAEELTSNFPQLLQTDRKTLLKNVKNIYETKGSERSIKAYFKLLYNQEVEIFYPSKTILKASDGVWIERKSVKALSGYNNYEVLNLNSALVDIIYFETAGVESLPRKIEASVIKSEKTTYTSPQSYEIFLELPPGTTSIPGPGAQATATATVVGGEITGVTVVSGGYDYTAAPTVVFTGDGTGATATATVSNGAITNIEIVTAGSGYTSATVSFDTTNVRSLIVNRGDTSAAENVLAYLDRSLSSVTSGTYAGVDAGFSVGDIFTITEPSGVATSTLRVSSVDEKNVPNEWTTINSGNGFTKSRFTVTLQSKTNENLDVDFITGYLYQYAGEYKGSRGQVSNVNRLQDNFKYQSYSYVIKSGISQDVWIKRFRDLIHPSGMEVFGDLILKHNVNFAPFFQISTNGLNIHVFKTEDIVISNDDQFTRVVQWVRAFSETQTVGDISTLEVEKNVTEILSASDVYDQDEYVCCDYLPINYVGSGVGKNIGKVLSDNPVTSEIFAPAVNFVRSFADEVANSTDSIVLALAISTTLSDAINAATDVIIISSEPNFLDTAGASDAYDQDNYAGPDALPINYVGSGVSKVLEKTIVDTSLATEQLESVVAFVRVFDESVSLTDTNSFGVSRTFTETLSTADSFSHQIFIPNNITDTSTVTDVFIATYNKEISEVVNTTDVLSINNNNGIVESLSVTEVSAAVMQKSFAETSTASDSGIITIQDYADPTFFGEDYVGAGYNI